MSLGALGGFSEATLSIGGSLQILRGLRNRAGLESQNARFAIIGSVIILELDKLAAERVLVTVGVRIGGEPLSIECKAKVKLLRGSADSEILIDGVQGSLDGASMVGNVVTTIDQVVAHDVHHIDRLENLGALLFGKGNEVLLTTGHSNGQSLVADGLAHSFEELGVGFDLINLLRVGHVPVILAVTAGIFPVNIYF